MKFATKILAVSLFVLLPTQAFADAVCADGVPVSGQLDWALNHNDVFNEGAECGLSILGGIAGYSFPAVRVGIGNVFKRPEMMRAAITIYKAGMVEQATEVATCSQIHNGAAYNCLKENKADVHAWLQRH